MKSFTLGGTERERLHISVFDFEHSPTGEFYDDNWVKVQVELALGGFSGDFTASFMTGDFVRFRDELITLHSSLVGEAQFSTIEDQLSLRLVGNGRGGVVVSGFAIDRCDDGNRLDFTIELDQTQLGPLIHDLNEITSAFPVRSA